MIDLGQIIKERMLSIENPDDSALYRASVESILELRHKVLRPGLPLETAYFEGDNLVTTWHFLIAHPLPLSNANMVCCASFILKPYDEQPAYQLRGMATHPDFQKRGFGKNLLDAAESTIDKRTGIGTFWCKARESAVPFYEKSCGWVTSSGSFEIPGIGPHRIMFKKL